MPGRCRIHKRVCLSIRRRPVSPKGKRLKTHQRRSSCHHRLTLTRLSSRRPCLTRLPSTPKVRKATDRTSNPTTLFHRPCRNLAFNWLIPLQPSSQKNLNPRQRKNSCYRRLTPTPLSRRQPSLARAPSTPKVRLTARRHCFISPADRWR